MKQKYTLVTINKDGYTISKQMNKQDAIRIAKMKADSLRESKQVFVYFYHNGQLGFLNPDGNHSVTGETW